MTHVRQRLLAKRIANAHFRQTFAQAQLRKRADTQMGRGLPPLNTEEETEEETEELISSKDASKEAYKLLSSTLYKKLRKAWGAKTSQFFHFYRVLRGIQLGRPVPDDLVSQFLKLSRDMGNAKSRYDGKKASPPVLDFLYKAKKKIKTKLKIVVSAYHSDPNKRGSNATWRPIVEQYGLVIEQLGRDKGVFLKIQSYLGSTVRWPKFVSMRPREEEMAKLQEEDPQAFAAMQRYGESVQTLNEIAVKNIQEDGLVPEKNYVSGRLVNIGVNEETKIALDMLRDRKKSLSKLLKAPTKTWVKWWRASFSFDDKNSEEYRTWLKSNPEPDVLSKTKQKEMRERWESLAPDDGDPDSIAAWKANQPITNGSDLKAEIEEAGERYGSFRKEYEKNAEEIIYDVDGDRLTPEEFKEKMTAYRKQMRQLTSENLIGSEMIDSMRLLSEKTLDKIGGDAYTVSLTDDEAKKHRLTKIFPVKEVPVRVLNNLIKANHRAAGGLGKPDLLFTGYQRTPGEEGNVPPLTVPVVASGRYAGIPVDHLVNENGRLIERNEYAYNERTGKATGRLKHDPTGYLLTEREPFVSVKQDGRLFLSISGDEKFKPLRDALFSIAGLMGEEGKRLYTPKVKLRQVAPPGFEYDNTHYHEQVDKGGGGKKVKRQQYGFAFTPENFGIVKDKIGTMALSAGAAKALEDYFEDLTKVEKAVQDENLAPYTTDNLGGFKEFVLTDTGEEWRTKKNHYVGLQRRNSGKPIAEKYARKAEKYRRRLKRGPELLAELRTLQEKISDKPNSPYLEQRQARVTEIIEIFDKKKENLGGFRVQLLGMQQKALAFMESRGDNGVCALDTGIGKTLTALAMIQKLLRDGFDSEDMTISEEEAQRQWDEYRALEEELALSPGDEGLLQKQADFQNSVAYEYPHGTNGRFLYVAPRSLVNNLDNEAIKFLSKEGYSVTGNRLDAVKAVQKGGFQAAMGKKPGSAADKLKITRGGGKGAVVIKNWSTEVKRYVAVFFDEAHEYITGTTGAVGKAFFRFKHPRKVILTASPMTNEPMDAYRLAAVANNEDLSDTKTPVGKALRSQMRQWKDTKCETVGGRVVGIKRGDPTVERDLKTWARTNLFYADKTKVTEDWAKPPDLIRDKEWPGGGTPVAMDPEVEEASREVGKLMQDQLKSLYLRFRDKGYRAKTVRIIDEDGNEREVSDPTQIRGKYTKGRVLDKDLEMTAKWNVRPLFKLLEDLALAPELAKRPKLPAIPKKVQGDPAAFKAAVAEQAKLEKLLDRMFPGVKPGGLLYPTIEVPDPRNAGQMKTVQRTIAHNPKFIAANDIVSGVLGADTDSTRRVLLWTESAKLVLSTARELSTKQMGIHVAALPTEIYFFEGGKQMSEYIHPGGGEEDGHAIPFKEMVYKLYDSQPMHKIRNPQAKKGKWAGFVTGKFVQGNSNVKTMTALGSAYQSGQNWQGFQTVVHLDRDDCSSENMKQRTARAYRQGQREQVREITLDAMYEAPPRPGDASLDEIRRLQQAMEGEIFDQIIVAAQEHKLGTEWKEIQQRLSKYTHIDQKAWEARIFPRSSATKD